MQTRLTLIVVIILFLIWSPAATAGEFYGTVTRVSDGDTITVTVGSERVVIRLYGIDAPESSQEFGLEATRALSAAILGKVVRVVSNGVDHYGRTIGVVFYSRVDMNRLMLLNGLAWHYKQYSKDPEYALAESQARMELKGLWGTDNPTPPWVFRRKK